MEGFPLPESTHPDIFKQHSVRIALQGANYLAVRVKDLDLDGHLADGGAEEAESGGVEALLEDALRGDVAA